MGVSMSLSSFFWLLVFLVLLFVFVSAAGIHGWF